MWAHSPTPLQVKPGYSHSLQRLADSCTNNAIRELNRICDLLTFTALSSRKLTGGSPLAGSNYRRTRHPHQTKTGGELRALTPFQFWYGRLEVRSWGKLDGGCSGAARSTRP